jgi:AAA+ superfamily predicted ATPase
MNEPSEQRKLVRELLSQLDQLLETAYARAQVLYEQREAGEVRPWAYRGLYITKEHAENLLAREPAAPVLSATEGNAAALDAFGQSQLWGSLGQHLRLTAFDVAVTVLALAPEIDLRYGGLYAYLQDDVTRRRPSVSLALDILSPSADARLAERQHFLASSPLIRHGLLTLVADPSHVNPTLLDHYLKLDDRAVLHLLGQARPGAIDAKEFESSTAGRPLRDDQTDLAGLIPMVIDARTYLRRLLVYFHGPNGMGQRDAAKALAASVQIPLVAAELATLPTQPDRFATALSTVLREGLLQGGLVYLGGSDAVEERSEQLAILLEALNRQPGPVIVSGARSWTPPAGSADGALVLEFPALGLGARREAWSEALLTARVPADDATIRLLAQRYPLSSDQIRSAARSVACRLRWHAERPSDDQPAVLEELTSAARAQSGHDLEGLAHRISPERSWEDLVLPPATKQQLRELCQRVGQGPRVFEEWGFSRKLSYGRGTSALFTGPSGCGKTMAAEVIAGELGLELFKIDLSQVVSKYIGETEKNLERIFSAAERTNAILFFDEADALFGKRSEIHDAHDRYANIEVGYLLQRMERYVGVAILATNLRGNLDDAFARRLACSIQFSFPDESLRHEIWKKSWPSTELLDSDVDLMELAKQFKLSGGNIKNVVLAAAFLGAEADAKVTRAQLFRAIAQEYQKVGRYVSEEELAAGFGAKLRGQA